MTTLLLPRTQNVEGVGQRGCGPGIHHRPLRGDVWFSAYHLSARPRIPETRADVYSALGAMGCHDQHTERNIRLKISSPRAAEIETTRRQNGF